uniref:Hpt domain-containing protein n=1 Tax=Escherichia coli TaxID=562 RepID=UPI002023827B
MSMDISDFYQTFFDEADELLADMEQHLLVLQPEAPDAEQLNAIFRAAHSIKGGAGTFGFSVLQETTHLMERHCCKVSDEAAFCLIQRPYISKTLLT